MPTKYEFRSYASEFANLWDEFVAQSRNGTFLLQRGYMDYHADRFSDQSLIVLEDRRIKALLPANRSGDELISHQGLTFGGLIFDDGMIASTMLAIFDELINYLRGGGVRIFIYKSIPHIYHKSPSEEDLYALFRNNAAVHSRTVLSVVDLARRLPFQERRRRGIRRARAADVTVGSSDDWAQFWELLETQLLAAHGVRPVHSLAEIKLLQSRFPENIRLFTATAGDRLLGGAVIYETETVAHVQYISSSDEGRANGVLDLLFASLLETEFAAKRYFDFGISNENNGRYLNAGLIEQKCGFGARAVVHDIYRLQV